MSKFFVPLALLPILGVLPATGTTIVATGDTMISTYDAFGGGANANNGGLNFLATIGDNIFVGGNSAATKALFYFDMSSYAGSVITGNATFSILITGVVPPGTDRSMDVRSILVPWSEGSVTWNNFGDAPGVTLGTDVSAVPISTVVFAPVNGVANFVIPQAIVQAWIDSPGSNNGFMLDMPIGADIYYDSREAATAGNRPSLTFVAVPEPSSSFLLLSGACLAFTGRRRR